MSKFKLTLGIAVMAIIGAVIFYACKKDVINQEPNVSVKSHKSYNLNTIDFSRITYNADERMLEFDSLEHYAEVIDALVEICNQYSENYIAELEERLGCIIDEADEDTVAAHVIADNFFPFNPLMDFIEQIGFTANSLYPILREQEIAWMANNERFESELNPFDEMGAGYVQSALHNTEGNVKVHKGLGITQNITMSLSFSVPIGGTNSDNFCNRKRDKVKSRDYTFTYNGKTRQIRTVLATTSCNIRGKTVAYYRNGANKPWLLWLVRVDVDFAGTKWRDCRDGFDHRPITKSKASHAAAGLVDVYATFKSDDLPTYIIPDGLPRISGKHWCKHSTNNKVITEIIDN